ncbi:hypothetical protein HY639_04815 [Candidatus Woesearchaeota archaeon]|nr:hypothetical protein [Candidatus Woesearchaeota archaeon]
MVVHCIKAGILNLTKIKKQALDHEYEGFQWWMIFGVDKDILSQHKRAKGYHYDKEVIKYKEYPLVVPHAQIHYRERSTKLTNHWIKTSVRKRKGIGIWPPMKPHKKLPTVILYTPSQNQ